MVNTVTSSGSCLCGSVELEAAAVVDKVHACHCTICRNWGGGPLLAVDCGTEVVLKGKEDIGVYDSSPWAERGFCRKCGTHLFYRLKETSQYIVPVGLLNLNDDALVFEHQIFIDEKPSYYHFANETESLTGAEVFTKYAPTREDE